MAWILAQYNFIFFDFTLTVSPYPRPAMLIQGVKSVYMCDFCLILHMCISSLREKNAYNLFNIGRYFISSLKQVFEFFPTIPAVIVLVIDTDIRGTFFSTARS